MMHELLLHPPADAPWRPFFQVQEVLRASDTLGPYCNAEASTPEQLVLTDPDTGVWALLAPRPLLEDEEGDGDGVLSLQIPYLRPRFFGIEGALFTVAIQQELGYLVEDPAAREPAPRTRSEEEMLPSWEAGNAALLREVREEGGPQPIEVDADLLARVFSHNLHRRELRHQAGPEVEVPRLFLATIPLQKEPAVICRYTAGSRIWLPDLVTQVVLRREKKGWLGSKAEEIRVEADALRPLLARWEEADGIPTGLRAFAPDAPARDPVWAPLEGPPGRQVALIDWNDVVDG